MTSPKSSTVGAPLFAPIEATLAPRMLLTGPRRRPLPFPFDAATLRYHYLGRNAAHAVVRGLLPEGGEMLFPAFFGPPVLQAPVDAGAAVRYYNVGPGLRVTIDDIRAALTPATKAIYLIHFNGFPGPIREVLELADERGLAVIEDAAHALLTTIDGRPAGSYGDAAIYSFYKWIPVPNGAALVVNRPGGPSLPAGTKTSRTSGVALSTFSLLDHLALRHGPPAERLRSAVRSIGKRASRAGNLTYVSTGGATYHREDLDWAMSGISHRILRAQDLPAIAARRRRNYARLADLLGDIAPPIQGALPEGVTPLFYPIAVENKRGVLLRLRARGVEGRNFWDQHHGTLPPGVFPETDELRRTTLELPIHQDLDDAAIDRLAAVVRDVIGTQPTAVAKAEAA